MFIQHRRRRLVREDNNNGAPSQLRRPPRPEDYPKALDDEYNQLLGRVEVSDVCTRTEHLNWQLTQAVYNAKWEAPGGSDHDVSTICGHLKQNLDALVYDEKHFTFFSLQATTALLLREETREQILRHIISRVLIHNICLHGSP